MRPLEAIAVTVIVSIGASCGRGGEQNPTDTGLGETISVRTNSDLIVDNVTDPLPSDDLVPRSMPTTTAKPGIPTLSSGTYTDTDTGSGSTTSSRDQASAECPDGLASDLPLILSGSTVPGNNEVGLATSPEVPRNPCGSTEEQACFHAANNERAKRGMALFLWDGDLADLGRSHAADMEQHDYLGHGSSASTDHLYQERGDALALKSGKFISVVENIAKGPPTGSEVVGLFMGSADHRAVILGEGMWASFTHMACGRSGPYWSMEFGY